MTRRQNLSAFPRVLFPMIASLSFALGCANFHRHVTKKRMAPEVEVTNSSARNQNGSGNLAPKIDHTSSADRHITTERGMALIHDAATVLAGTAIMHRFKFKNPHDTTLRFLGNEQLAKSCGCTSASVVAPEIQPGQQGTVVMKIDTEGKYGQLRENVVVPWQTESGESWYIECTMSAEVQSAIVTSPSEVYFDRQRIRNRKPVTIYVRSDRKLDWDKAKTSLIGSHLQISKRSINTDRGVLTLQLRCGDAHRSRDRRGEIRIRIPDMNGVEHSQSIPIFSESTTLLQASPPILVFKSNSVIAAQNQQGRRNLRAPSDSAGQRRSEPIASNVDAESSPHHAMLILSGELIRQGNQVASLDLNLEPLRWKATPLGTNAIKLDITLPNATAAVRRSELTVRMSNDYVYTLPVAIKD